MNFNLFSFRVLIYIALTKHTAYNIILAHPVCSYDEGAASGVQTGARSDFVGRSRGASEAEG